MRTLRAAVVAMCALMTTLGAMPAAAQYTFDPTTDVFQGGHVYFGTAKADGGSYLPDVTIVLEIDQTNYIFVTNRLGRFSARLPIEVNSDGVVATCSKPGYDVVRVTKRRGMNDGKASLQIDCTLRPAAG